mmetsp:Transcript_19748/g.37070  ORF Transcript_19748/g.37070 Transcript_19748/m.37070 type:complete len:91 (-) Transcript_19748:3646-3918(-)
MHQISIGMIPGADPSPIYETYTVPSQITQATPDSQHQLQRDMVLYQRRNRHFILADVNYVIGGISSFCSSSSHIAEQQEHPNGRRRAFPS